MSPWPPEPVDRRFAVCVVEDQEPYRAWLVRALARRDLVVTAAVGTLREGLDAITTRPPDVAIIDNHLPDGLGIDLCRAVSTSVRGVTLLLHTGLISAQDEAEAFDAGASAVVLKSIRGSDLFDAIDAHRPRPRGQ